MIRTIEQFLFTLAVRLNDWRWRRAQRKRAMIIAQVFEVEVDRLRLAPR